MQCKFCGEEFKTTQKNKKYCSKECRNLKQNEVRFKKEKITIRIYSGISRGLTEGRSGSLESILGYSIDDLKKKLIKEIPNGYSYSDFENSKLAIDHIIPLKAYSFSSVEDINFKKCWSIKNLRLITLLENSIKGAILDFGLVEKYGLWDILPDKIRL